MKRNQLQDVKKQKEDINFVITWDVSWALGFLLSSFDSEKQLIVTTYIIGLCIGLCAFLDNSFSSSDKYTPKDFLRLLTLMSSKIKILSYDTTSIELE